MAMAPTGVTALVVIAITLAVFHRVDDLAHLLDRPAVHILQAALCLFDELVLHSLDALHSYLIMPHA